jgi:hypothetical protein
MSYIRVALKCKKIKVRFTEVKAPLFQGKTLPEKETVIAELSESHIIINGPN